MLPEVWCALEVTPENYRLRRDRTTDCPRNANCVNGPRMIDAIIVGAGAAGLMAARELRHAGKAVIILEAGKRCGGRVLTLPDTGAGVPVELGAEFIHGDAPETTRLLDEARLATVPVRGEHYRSDRGELSPQGPVWKRMRKVFRHLNPDRKHDRSFQDFLDEKPGGRRLKRERELARGFVQGYNGADASLISEKSIAQQGDPTEGAADARRVVNGYTALIDYMRRDLGDVIRFDARVRSIKWDEAQVCATDQAGNEYTARAIVVAVPLPILQDESIVFDPEIPALRKAAGQLAMGQVIRVNVVVKERFWDKKIDRLSFVHTPARPFNVWWTQSPLQAALITGWAGGPPAVELSHGGNVEDAAIAELARAFGSRRDRIENLIDSIHTHDWFADPNIGGAYSYVGIGGTYAPRVLARPINDTVYVAGEATDSESSGTVEGAIASGKRAARKIIRAAASA